jgi:SAM-dependent methyltransferase
MRRRLEPELLEGADQALAYAQADFSESNRLFLKLLSDLNPGDLKGKQALDLGCGTADIVIRFLRAWPGSRCDALDGSMAMLELARAALEALSGLAPRCQLLHDSLPSPYLAPGAYDLILSNSLLHHLHDPQVLWRAVRATGKPGAIVLVMDLMRPPSPGWAESLVVTYVGDEPELLQSAYRASLFAAFEPAEVQAQLAAAGLESLEVAVVSDRHLAVAGRLPGGTES